MSHEIHVNEKGTASMAFVGSRDQIWHGLGQELTKGASIDVWKKEAGFDWHIKDAPVKFHDGDDMVSYGGQRVLFRSDDKSHLSIVSDNYKIVQPDEVLEFFRDLVGDAGMELSTAGILFGGRRFWALADTKNVGKVKKNDSIKGNLLLTSSCDGTLATTASFVATRVVCNNTLRIALSEDQKSRVRITHSRTFDPAEIKDALGLIDSAWDLFISQVTDMSKFNISQEKARDFVYELVSSKNKLVDDQPYTTTKNLESIMNKFNNGMGNEGKTLWDLVNGATEHYQYEMGRTKLADTKLWGNFFGGEADKKDAAFAQAVALLG